MAHDPPHTAPATDAASAPPATAEPEAPEAPSDGPSDEGEPDPAPAADAGSTASESSDRAVEASADRVDLDDILSRIHESETGGSRSGSDGPSAPGPNAPLTDPRDLERPDDRAAVTVASTGALSFRPVVASWSARAIGLFVDVVALLVALVPGTYLVASTGVLPIRLLGLAIDVVAYLAVTVWYARSVARTGRWLGNRVARTRVVNAVGGTNLEAGAAATRFLLRTLVSPILMFGFYVARKDAQRRTFHDTFVGSIVVGRPRQTWSADDPTP